MWGSNVVGAIKQKGSNFKGAFASREAAIKYLEASPPAGEEFGPDTKGQRWNNIDLAPSPMMDRKWTQWTYLAFWVAHASNAGNWTAGSSLISIGLAPIETWIALATAHIFITICIVLNGRGPARYHVGFPVMARSAYGLWGSYVPVFMRAFVTLIWNSTNSYYGSRCLTVAITCIWPSYGTMKNHLPVSAGIKTNDLISYFLFMIVFICFSFIHARDLRWFYVFKSIFVFACMHGILIWYMKKAGGANLSILATTTKVDQTTHIWRVLQAFNTGLGTASSLSVNQGDIARYANRPNAALWTTLIGFPVASALPCLYGILVAAAAKVLSGTAYWNTWETMGFMLSQYPDNSGARFGIFLCSMSIALAYLAVNLATNSLPFGSDMSALFPRWFTIRRGQVLCTCLGMALVPWKVLSNAKALLTFLSGYGYWLAPIASVLSVDYFLIKKGNLRIPELYVGDTTSRFWYYKGVNWRAVSVTILALIPCLPSFAAQIDVNHLGLPIGAQRMFYISFTFTWFFAGLMYYVSYLIFPERSEKARAERAMKFEQMADDMDADEKRVLAMGSGEEDAAGREEFADEKEKMDAVSRSYIVAK